MWTHAGIVTEPAADRADQARPSDSGGSEGPPTHKYLCMCGGRGQRDGGTAAEWSGRREDGATSPSSPRGAGPGRAGLDRTATPATRAPGDRVGNVWPRHGEAWPSYGPEAGPGWKGVRARARVWGTGARGAKDTSLTSSTGAGRAEKYYPLLWRQRQDRQDV